MITINNNLSSYIIQSHLDGTIRALNKSIEQMTTGFKVNHAKDNAANFGIITNMTTRLGSLEVAEDNASMALDMISTASANLDLISSHLSRLRDLANISVNGTYGQNSRNTLQAELTSRLDEISRILELGDYNNKQLFVETNRNTPSGISTFSNDELYSEIEVMAGRDTTFDELGITSRDVNIYDKGGSLSKTFSFDGIDTIGKFLDVLNGSGLSASIKNGIISIESESGYYITGGLADALGITTQISTVITSSSSSSSQSISYTKTLEADTTTTFAEAGLDAVGKSVEIYTKNTGQKVGTITIDSNTKTFKDLFQSLAGYGITASMSDGKITLESNDNYISGEIANLLGIGTVSNIVTGTTGISQTSGNAIQYTTEVTATLATELRELGISDTSIIIENANELALKTIAVSSTDTVQDFFNLLASNSISASLTDGVITLSGANIISGELAETLGITKILEQEGESTTVGIEYVSDSIAKSKTISVTEVTTLAMPQPGELLTSFTYIDASDCQDIADVDVTYLEAKTYQITTTEGLVKLAELLKNPYNSGATIVLMNDLDLSSLNDWSPMTFNHYTFEGNGYTISNLKGHLFGYVAGSDIKNLKLIDAEMDGAEHSGILAESVEDSLIFNCSVTGQIIHDVDLPMAPSDSAGLIGRMEGSRVQYCNSNVDIQSNDYPQYAAGLIYSVSTDKGSSFEISGCYTSGSASAYSYYNGGLVNRLDIFESTLDSHYVIANNNTNITNAKGSFIGFVSAEHYQDIRALDFYNNTCVAAGTESTMYGDVITVSVNTTAESTMREFGASDSGNIIFFDEEVGSSYSIYIGEETTLNDIIYILQVRGINAQFDEDSRQLKIGACSTAYILDLSENLQNILGLKVGEGITYETRSTAIYSNSSSDKFYTTAAAAVTDTTKLTDIGFKKGRIELLEVNSNKKVYFTINDSSTVADIVSEINKQPGLNAELTNEMLTVSGSSSAFITDMNSDFASIFKLAGAGDGKTYTIVNNTTHENTASNETFYAQSTSELSLDAKLSEIAGYSNGNGKIAIHRDNGSYVTISLSGTNTVQDFFNRIKGYGIEGELAGGKIILKSDGDIYLESVNGGSNLLSALNLNKPQKVEEIITSNNNSKQLTYNKILQSDWRNYEFDTTFGVVGGNPNDTINLDFEFNLNFGIDISSVDTAKSALTDLDRMLQQISLAQTELGAAQNRYESILEDISIQYENLLSSRSTIQDADIGEVSSEYIKKQILSQAAVTLLATANQTPEIAIQLINGAYRT